MTSGDQNLHTRSMGLPRVFFQGTASANVPTGNNEGPPALIDIPTCSLNPLPLKNDTSIRTWLMQASTDGSTMLGGWNYFGDNSFRFDRVTVTAVQGLDGVVLNKCGQDDLIDQAVQLQGHRTPGGHRTNPVTVDIDPYSDFASYILADLFTISKAGDPLFSAEGLKPANMRWTNTTRNLYFPGEGAEGSFLQFVVENDGNGKSPFQWNTAGSDVLAQLQDAVGQADGMVITCVAYNFNLNVLSASQMADRFNQGDFVNNPAVGYVVGSLGVWHRDEPTQIPSGRYLGPVGDPIVLGKKSFQLGPTIAMVDARPGFVTLNMMNTVPETDQTQEKAVVGKLYLAWREHDQDEPQRVSAEPIVYDREAYLKTVGYVDVEYGAEWNAAKLQQGQFLLLREAAGQRTVVLQELEFVVSTDDWQVYVDQGDSAPINLQVFRHGEPAPGVDVTVSQYRLIPIGPAAANDSFGARLVGTQDLGLPAALTLDSADGIYTSDECGRIRVTVTGADLGTVILRFTIEGRQDLPWSWNQSEMDFYSHVRVMPNECLKHIPATWENVYEHVLRYYFLVYPAMSQVIPLNNEEQVGKMAQQILARLNEPFSHTTYMPVTRDLPKGKKELLERWCHEHLEAGGH